MVAFWLRLAIVACITVTTIACGSSDKTPPSNQKGSALIAGESSMESIRDAIYKDDKVRFSAISNGCTKTTDFIVEQRISNGRCELTVVRTTLDLCRRASALINIELDWSLPSGCTGMDIVFLNPELTPLQPGFERRLETGD